MTVSASFPSWLRGERRGVAEALVVGLLVAVIHAGGSPR